MKFEWDKKKNSVNLAKHGLAFEDVVHVFNSENVVTVPSDYTHEPRMITTGELYGSLITIVTTERAQKTRIISARKASRKEKERYHDRFPE